MMENVLKPDAGPPRAAMVLAAGYGRRMMPLTATLPKPLLTIGGRTMLDQALDRLKADGIARIVVNAGYCGEQIVEACKARHDRAIEVSWEPEPLETGGGVKQALPLLGDEAFFVINADLPWQERDEPVLRRMRAAWDPARMDVLLLIMPKRRARGFQHGDYTRDSDARLRRLRDEPHDDVFLGVSIVKPQLYAAWPEHFFSNLKIFDTAERGGRLFGCMHHGTAYHIGTPEDWRQANALLASGAGWEPDAA